MTSNMYYVLLTVLLIMIFSVLIADTIYFFMLKQDDNTVSQSELKNMFVFNLLLTVIAGATIVFVMVTATSKCKFN
ncbi:MAG: hypothetical protein KatS3mg101_0891 [Patescibacteria group bacterium]|nr:MAG: hypothetical protein KatS3mg101_0891 [Patescibacteria group bacterium]